MRKLLLILLPILCISIFASCSSDLSDSKDYNIHPYAKTERERHLVRALAMNQTAEVYEFKAPKEIQSIKIHAYRYEKEKGWQDYGGAGITRSKEDLEKINEGTCAIILHNDLSVSLYIETFGGFSTSIPGYLTEGNKELLGSGYSILDEQAEIELNKEVFLAYMASKESGLSMPSLDQSSLQEVLARTDHSEDFIQVISLEFLDTEI